MSFEIKSPISNNVYKTINYTLKSDLENVLTKAVTEQKEWAAIKISQRKSILRAGLEQILGKKKELAEELTNLIGRPIVQTPSEIDGFAYRANYLLDISEEALKPAIIEETALDIRKIVKEPIGTVLIIGAWNYPYLVVVNTLIPALVAGNSVIIKHAPQTAPIADRICEAFKKVGLPNGVLQSINLSNEDAEQLVADARISFVSLVGSVRAGKAVAKTAIINRPNDFMRINLELGGCDAAYVRGDANVEDSAKSLVEGAFYNSGQSCCGIQRIFVNSSIYEEFIQAFKRIVETDVIMGDPHCPQTTMGPVVSADAAAIIKEKIAADTKQCEFFTIPTVSNKESTYISPVILLNPPVDSNVMSEEIFGPVVGISRVKDDEEAIERINETVFGLTASIWTRDTDLVEQVISPKLAVGTVFANRCDALHPGLPWSSQKLSGFGLSLSKLAYDQVTRSKSINIRKMI